VLEAARGRVETVATAHQLFYKSDALEGLQSDDLIRTVTDSFVALGQHDRLQVSVSADSAKLSNDRAIPVALILNELLSNAVKHGVKGQSDARIDVSLKVTDGVYELIVQDNGPGFDAQSAGKRASGLGLIRALVRQLGGAFEIQQAGGARCIVRFGKRGEIDDTAKLH
jgi:two-component sensor histidine kinase